jgi:hypothetical protein
MAGNAFQEPVPLIVTSGLFAFGKKMVEKKVMLNAFALKVLMTETR